MENFISVLISKPVMFGFYAILFGFGAVMSMRSLVFRKWDELANYFILMMLAFIGLSCQLYWSDIGHQGGWELRIFSGYKTP